MNLELEEVERITSFCLRRLPLGEITLESLGIEKMT